jgi:ribosomal protein L16 Arg81 hydroxylase
MGLRQAIDPWSIDDFVANAWERKPLVFARSDRSYFSSLVSVAEFDSILAASGLRRPYFRVFSRGQLLPDDQTTTSRQLGPDVDSGLADLNKLYDEYAAGGTLALQAAERWWPSFRDLAGDFQTELGFPAQVHVYLTPSGAQGAPVHYDTHDVFVLQVEGRKTWDVWPPTKVLPLRLSENAYDAEAVDGRARSEPALSVVLDAGHSLYLPRGFIHRARTEATSSLHVTVSIMVDRWVDVAEAAISQRLNTLREEVDLRDSIPFGRVPMAEPTPAEVERYAAVAETLLRDLAADLEGGLAAVRDRARGYSGPSIRGRFVDVVEAPPIDESELLR